MWDVNLSSSPRVVQNMNYHKYVVNVILQKNKTKEDLANFYHASICSPVSMAIQTVIRNGHFATWPGISKINFSKYITDTVAIDKGHLDQERKNLQPTKTLHGVHEILPAQNLQTKTTRTANIYSLIIPFTARELAYGDLTGAFPYTSARGSKYIYNV